MIEADYKTTLTPTKKKYLLVMYELENKFERIRSVDIANNLNVKKASVSNMLPSLVDENLIKRLPKGRLAFTEYGREYASELYTSYVKLYDFFSTTLGSSDENARCDAMSCLCGMSGENIGNFTEYIDGAAL